MTTKDLPRPGAVLQKDSTVMQKTHFDLSAATAVSATDFFRTAREGGIFYADAPLVLRESYCGGGAVLVAPGGVTVDGAADLTLSDLVIIGSLTIRNAAAVTLDRVEIESADTALTAGETVTGLTVRHCRLCGRTAVDHAATDSKILYSYLGFTEVGLRDRTACGTEVYHCVIEGRGIGLLSSACDAVYRNLTVTTDENGIGLSLEGAENTLAALNTVRGARRSVRLADAYNTVLLLSDVVSVEAENCRDIFICDNTVSDRLTAKHNTYILADRNKVTGITLQEANRYPSGDNLLDIHARPAFGADESLLPQVDRDLFIGRRAKAYVKDAMDGRNLPIADYIATHAEQDAYVILPPGVYATDSILCLGKAHSHTTVYGYGVCMERQTDLHSLLNFREAEHITVKGLTVAFRQQSCGQVYVLEKLGAERLRVVTGAGMMDEFGNTNPAYYNTTGIGATRTGHFYAYCDTDFVSIEPTRETVEGMPTMIMTVRPSVYEMIRRGDILTSKASNGSVTTSLLGGCKNIVFYDFTLYGNSGGFAFVEENTLTSTTYYRVLDTTKNGPIIDEATYDRYRALEERYGISLEISQDALGRYRGSLPHIGSIDATHTTGCAEGSQATFCLFENMCDDATNQNHNHARLGGVRDNGDGTLTITYKGDYSNFHYVVYKGCGDANKVCRDFKVGDRIYIYTSRGQLVCDTKVLSATRALGPFPFNWKAHGGPDQIAKVERYEVTVPAGTVNMDILADFDLNDNSWKPEQRVLVDNMSMASNGFYFENCLFRNIRSRGLLIKASEGRIENCTFRHIGMSCAAILYELWWGESGVTEHMLIQNNLFDHTGYFENASNYSPISIQGLGSSVDEDYLLYNRITISHNRVINRTTDYAVYINSAKEVRLIDNDFGEFVGNDFARVPAAPESAAAPKPVINLCGAMNIEIAGNTFPKTDCIKNQITAAHIKHIFGKDVEKGGMPLFPDQE